LPSTVIGNTTHPVLQAAYLYYYATDSGLQGGEDAEQLVKKRLQALIGDAIIIANEAGFDVFNALTLMDNVSILQDLKVCQIFLSFGLWLMQN
jgi:glycylpeptide N-tetradecanoyltransferase